jgi:hypothetical protein
MRSILDIDKFGKIHYFSICTMNKILLSLRYFNDLGKIFVSSVCIIGLI